MNCRPPSQNEKDLPVAACSARPNTTRAVASFAMLSPSNTVATRRGTRRRWMMASAATVSVGETMAPSTTAAAQGSPIRAWATAATMAVVASTRPMESNPMARASARMSRNEEVRDCW